MKPKYTPMMMQYMEIKEQYPDLIILYRLGDFYEMFFDDAIKGSKILEIALTSRGSIGDEKIPMCGVPFHAVSGYIQKFLDAGCKVGIVEQLEDPKGVKGIVKRGVVKILSPGTDVEIGLQAEVNNYIASIKSYDSSFVMAFCDISTGEFLVSTVNKTRNALESEILSRGVKEIVITNDQDTSIFSSLQNHYGILLSIHNDESLNKDYEHLFRNLDDIRQIRGSALLLNYLVLMQKTSLQHIKTIRNIVDDEVLKMDVFTKINLELVETNRGKNRNGSLLWLLDKTHTAMGARMLKSWVDKPLYNFEAINNRLDVIEVMNKNFIVRDTLKELLKEVYDIERLVARIVCGNVNGRDLIWLGKSLAILPEFIDQVSRLNHPEILELVNVIPNLTYLTDILQNAFVDNPPITIKDGGMFKVGYNTELDHFLLSKRDGKQWLIDYENEEKERTGIKNLRVGFNKVFGYYIEVSKGSVPLVKEEYGFERRQSIANGERYITPKLKELETILLHADEKGNELEYVLFNEIKSDIKERVEELQLVASIIAKIDVYQSLATVSNQNGYTRPYFNNDHIVEIKNGRHPVIEKVLGKDKYVENDLIMSPTDYVLLITGPNMGGKSTYMRQIALLVILAQLGCYVPATYANMPLFDAIYTRIGASDDLISGQSTFMVEMMESNVALRNATENSFILFDEIGRGTATFDGMAIAQSIVEYIATKVKCITLFSTHYHELTLLEENIPGIRNIHAGVSEKNDEIVFLYKMQDGKTSKSYGINVARLANIPENILSRAKDILTVLETTSNYSSLKSDKIVYVDRDSEVESMLSKIEPMNLSPMDALATLVELKKMVGGE